MFEHSLGNYDIFPLLYESKPHKIRNFKKNSENLRPKKLLIDPCSFYSDTFLQEFLVLGAVARSEASSLGMQVAPSSIPTSGIFFRGDLVMKTFVRPFSLFR